LSGVDFRHKRHRQGGDHRVQQHQLVARVTTRIVQCSLDLRSSARH
jgi:hypothetical protein